MGPDERRRHVRGEERAIHLITDDLTHPVRITRIPQHRRMALEAAKFNSVRGNFKFNTNHFPIQDYYARVITKDAKGRITNRLLATPVLKNHADAYVGSCKMPG